MSKIKAAIATLLLVLPAMSVLPALGLAAGGGLVNSVYAQDPADPNAPPAQAEPDAIPDQELVVECPEGDCLFEKYINPAINTLAALVGVAVTISIIVGGIRYGTSADNPQKVSEAKQRILNSILVLIGFFLFYAFLNYIIPGGLVGGGN